MCGHATIALGRFLVDTQDMSLFPRRGELTYDERSKATKIILHAPCGALEITVPVILKEDKMWSDPTRPVSFLGVPSFVTGRKVVVSIPANRRWPQLERSGRSAVAVDVAYGGAFYGIVSAQDLGFAAGLGKEYSLGDFDVATSALKSCLLERTELFKHPTERDLEFLYGVIVVDRSRGSASDKSVRGSDVGLCFFADREVDRSPTGSGVMARIALAVSAGELALGDSWSYHSVVSAKSGEGAFRGTVASIGSEGVVARVEGVAFYTGTHSFLAESRDPLGDGFVLEL
jgi:trans-L-3-hydroxyproline dehydratase